MKCLIRVYTKTRHVEKIKKFLESIKVEFEIFTIHDTPQDSPFDLGVSYCYPRKITNPLLSKPKKGFVNYHHIKLISPWILKEKSGVKFAWVGAEWNLDSYNFKVLPGIINFNINHHTNVNLMLPKEEKNIIIPAGLPIVNLIPLTDKKINLVNQVIPEKEMDSMRRSPQQSYFHGWRTSKRLLKENKSKCPFGFGE